MWRAAYAWSAESRSDRQIIFLSADPIAAPASPDHAPRGAFLHVWPVAADGWQVEGKRRIVGHGGCGAGLIREATCRNNDLLRESRPLRHRRRKNSHA
jgi:hypothetical protein